MPRALRDRRAVFYGEGGEDEDSALTVKAVAAAVEDADDGADSDDSHGSDAKTPPKRAAAGKKGAAASSKAAAKPTGAKKPKAAGVATASIYASVSGNKNVTGMVAAWLERFEGEASRPAAGVELLNFIFRCCGATSDLVEPEGSPPDADELSELASRLSSTISSDDSSPAGAGDSLLSPSSKRREARAFRAGFLDWWEGVVASAPLDTLTGAPDLMDTLVTSYLLPLTSSPTRAIRHASTLALMRIGSALLRRAGALRAQLESVQRQLAADDKVWKALQARAAAGGGADSEAAAPAGGKAASGAKRRFAPKNGTTDDAALAAQVHALALAEAADKVSQHERNEEALAAGIAAIEGTVVDGIFKGAFVHRYRDVAADVRVDVLAEYATWMTSAPDAMLANSYLKYVGWMLNDGESGDVRLHALRALGACLALGPAYWPRLEDFVGRFRPRIAELSRDDDDRVAAAALDVLRGALHAEHITVAELVAVREALLSDDVELRRRAGAFFLDQIPAFADAPAPEGTSGGADGGDGVELEESAAGAGGGRRRAAGGGGAAAKAGQAAARAAAVQAAASQRAHYQLLSIVSTARSLLPEGLKDSDHAAGVEASPMMELIASAFWGLPEAGVLSNWPAYVAVLMGDGKSEAAAGAGASASQQRTGRRGKGAAALDDDDEASPSSDAAADVIAEFELGLDKDTGELAPLRQPLLLRLLAACAMRAVGLSSVDGEVAPASAAEERKASAPAGGSPSRDSSVAAGASLPTAASSAAVEKSRLAFSNDLAPALPELFSRFSADPFAIVILCTLVNVMSLQVYGVTRQGKAFSDLLYYLTRLAGTHADGRVLRALGASLRYLSREPHAKSRDAEAAVNRLVSSLAAKAAKLASAVVGGGAPAAPAPATAAAAPSKSRRRTTKVVAAAAAAAAASSAMDAEEQEDEEDATTANSAAAAASEDGASAALSLLVGALRRLTCLVDAMPHLVAVPDLAPGSPLADALQSLLQKGKLALATAEADEGDDDTAAAVAPPSGAAAALLGNAEALPEALSLQLSLLKAAVASAVAAAGALGPKPTDVDVAGVEALASSAGSLRDTLMGNAEPLLALRHPEGEGKGEDGYAVPARGVTSAQRAFIWRARYAAFRAVCSVGVACGPSELSGTPLDALAWRGNSVPAFAALLETFLSSALAASTADLVAMGVSQPSADPADEDEGDELLLEGEGGDAAAVAAAARAARSAALESAVHNSKALFLLAPASHLAMAMPAAGEMQLLLTRRDGGGATEAGAPGASFVKGALAHLKKSSPGAYFSSLLAGIKLDCGDIARGAAALEAAPREAESNEDVEALAASLSALIASASDRAKKSAAFVGKPKDTDSLLGLVTMLQNGCVAALLDPPASLVVFGLLSHFLAGVPPASCAPILRFMDSAIRKVVGKEDAQNLMNNANKWLHRRKKVSSDEEVLMGTGIMEFGGYAMEQLRPWAVCLAFRAAVDGGGKAKEQRPANVVGSCIDALRVSVGLPMSTDAGSAPSAKSAAKSHAKAAAAVSSAGKRGAGVASSSGSVAASGSAMDEEEEGDEGGTRGGSGSSAVRKLALGGGSRAPPSRAAPAGAANRGSSSSRSTGGRRASGAGTSGRPAQPEEDSQMLDDGELALVRQAAPSGGMQMSLPYAASVGRSSSSSQSTAFSGKQQQQQRGLSRTISIGADSVGTQVSDDGDYYAAAEAAAAARRGQQANRPAASGGSGALRARLDDDMED